MADKTIVAMYDDAADARRVVDDLTDIGITNGRVDVFEGSTAYGSTRTGAAGAPGAVAGTTSAGGLGGTGDAARADVGDVFDRLRDAGVPQSDAEIYAEGVRRGATVVMARVDDSEVEQGLDVMSRHQPVDVDDRGTAWRSAGWTGYDASAPRYTDEQITEERARYGYGTDTREDTGIGSAAAAMRDVDETGRTTRTGAGEETVIPITEEELRVGKRAVERGGVRVRSYVVETPVEEQVRLRDETVNVERRRVDRPADEVGNAFQERTVEVRETDEEAVVSKKARVTEEVVVKKDVEERTQTVSDSVRHTEVEVEKPGTTERTDIARDKDRNV